MAARPELRDKTVGEYGVKPLMMAAYYGHPEAVEVLADGGALLDLQDGAGRTALWYAAYSNHLAMWWAAYRKHPAVVRLLVGRGADQTIKCCDGETPREIAVRFGHAECAALLR